MANVGQVKVNGNASVKVNGLGPTTYIVDYDDVEDAVVNLQTENCTVAGIDIESGHIAVQTTSNATVVAAIANVTSVVATFEDNWPVA